MTPAIRELFEYALRHVTAKDISDFCPGDPGYGDYVRAFNAILELSTLPKEADFDITETIGLTIWSKADDWPDPVRFRRFRTLTNAVGIALLVEDANGAEQNLRPNYLAIRSIEDAHTLQDDALLRLLPAAFADLQQSAAETLDQPEEVPFLLLGQLLLAFRGFPPTADIPRLVEAVTTEAARQECRASTAFFWGCTFFDQLHERWQHFVRICFPPDSTDEAVNSLRAALLCSPLPRS
jgi:hypothetical protein